MENIQHNLFFERNIEVFRKAKADLKTAVNVTMAYSYYEAGCMIVEEEQDGQARATYGKRILMELSERLIPNLAANDHLLQTKTRISGSNR